MNLERPYRQYVEQQKRRNPSLTNLCSFLQSPEHFTPRIACLDFTAGSAVPRQRRLAKESLRSELDEKSKSAHIYDKAGVDLQVVGRILVIENLTADIVELLGSSLNIDPLFFASHVHAPEKALESQTPALVNLPSRYKHVNFINIHYHRSVSLKGTNRRVGKLLRCSNIPRKLSILPPIKGAQFGLVQHCCSVLKTIDREKRWLGIILVDSPISDYYINPGSGALLTQIHVPSELFLRGYEDFLPPPSFSSDIPFQSGPTRSSLLEDLLYYWAAEPPASYSPKDIPHLLSLSHYPLKIIAAEWSIYLNILHNSIKEYEYRSKDTPDFLAEVERLNTYLADLQTWRRRALASRQKVDHVIRSVSIFQQQTMLQEPNKRGNPSSNDDEEATSLKEDYIHIKTSLTEYAGMMENMLPVLTSFAQIVDSRRSFAETANISRLTILALIFVPLSFLSSLFSMTADYGPGGNLFWVYFAVAVPVTMAVFFVARPPRARDWRWMMDFVTRRFRGERGGWGEGERPVRAETEASMM